MWPFLQAILTNPNFISFIVSIGAGATWDTIKWMGSDSPQEKDYGPLALDMLSDVFMQFYQAKEMEYDENIVMDSLLNAIRSERIQQVTDVSREVVSIIVGSDLTEEDYAVWQQCFTQICSKEKYQIIWRSIILSGTLSKPQKEHGTWAKNRFNDNYCSIDFQFGGQAIPALDKIDFSIKRDEWYDLVMLILEVLLNAQYHGCAKLCRLLITNNAISVIDNGGQFNPLDLLQRESVGGGGHALRFFSRKYTHVSLSYEFTSDMNSFTIEYPGSVFDICELCEIEVPSLLTYPDALATFPNGSFKYGFVDFEKTFQKDGFHGLALSIVLKLYRLLSKKIEDKICETIYIHYPQNGVGLYVYERMALIQEQMSEDDNIDKIHLLPPGEC